MKTGTWDEYYTYTDSMGAEFWAHPRTAAVQTKADAWEAWKDMMDGEEWVPEINHVTLKTRPDWAHEYMRYAGHDQWICDGCPLESCHCDEEK